MALIPTLERGTSDRGHILMSVMGMGLLVAMLSVTGIVIWVRKRHAHVQAALRGESGRPMPTAQPSA